MSVFKKNPIIILTKSWRQFKDISEEFIFWYPEDVLNENLGKIFRGIDETITEWISSGLRMFSRSFWDNLCNHLMNSYENSLLVAFVFFCVLFGCCSFWVRVPFFFPKYQDISFTVKRFVRGYSRNDTLSWVCDIPDLRIHWTKYEGQNKCHFWPRHSFSRVARQFHFFLWIGVFLWVFLKTYSVQES